MHPQSILAVIIIHTLFLHRLPSIPYHYIISSSLIQSHTVLYHPIPSSTPITPPLQTSYPQPPIRKDTPLHTPKQSNKLRDNLKSETT